MSFEASAELLQALSPKFPKLTRLLRAFIDDPRDGLEIDNVMVRLYCATSEIPKRQTVTQQLHDAVSRGFLTRKGRGLYSITPTGRRWLDEIQAQQRLV
jgi:DNA-binding PadR family transcriptional regulator